MEYEDLRIAKLREYLLGIIDNILDNQDSKINANFLSNEVFNYSLDKIPTETSVQKWITGTTIKKDVYSFRSRMDYSPNTIDNLKNIGFFENFENIISTKNKKRELPDIDNIEKIECLSCGTMSNSETNTAEFDIQIQATYREDL